MSKSQLLYLFGAAAICVAISLLTVLYWRGYVIKGDPVFNRSLTKTKGDVVEAFRDCGRCKLDENGDIVSLYLHKEIQRGTRGRPLPSLKHNNDVMKYVKQLESLKHFSFSPTTEIDKHALKDIAEMDQLESLSFNGINIDDDALAELETLKNLKSIDLYATKVSKQAVVRFIESHPGCEVRWGSTLDPTNPALKTIKAVQESEVRRKQRQQLKQQPLRK